VKVPRSFSITFVALLIATAALAADDIVWQLPLGDGHVGGCQLQFTRFAKGDKGQLFLEADSRDDKGDGTRVSLCQGGFSRRETTT
jgi:hypothetical protein